jgi:hypothetical protein
MNPTHPTQSPPRHPHLPPPHHAHTRFPESKIHAFSAHVTFTQTVIIQGLTRTTSTISPSDILFLLLFTAKTRLPLYGDASVSIHCPLFPPRQCLSPCLIIIHAAPRTPNVSQLLTHVHSIKSYRDFYSAGPPQGFAFSSGPAGIFNGHKSAVLWAKRGKVHQGVGNAEREVVVRKD